MTEELLTMILIGVAIVLLVVLVIVAIEIIRTVRKVRTSVDDLMPSVNETVTKVNTTISTLEPALKRVDPLIERVSLTVDAVNLEIMRADQILSDISDVTDMASGAAKKVTGITEAPLNLLTSATDKIRNVFVDKKSTRKTERMLKQAEGAASGLPATTSASASVPVSGVKPAANAEPVPIAASAAQAQPIPSEAAPAAGEASTVSRETPVIEPIAQPDEVLEQVTHTIEQQVARAAETPAAVQSSQARPLSEDFKPRSTYTRP